MTVLTDAIERRLAERADLFLAVQEDGGSLVVSGMVGSEEQRQAALDIVAELAGRRPVIDDIEVSDRLPEGLEESARGLRGERGIPRVQRAPAGLALEPGDFASQALLDSAEEAAGPEWSLEEDLVAEGDEVYVPPVDPTSSGTEVIGGLELSSMDDVPVEASSDHTLGDEAIREAVLRELREDAATSGLALEVDVEGGVVRLRGRAPSLEDVESAEEVAARVPGVLEVVEELEVAALDP